MRVPGFSLLLACCVAAAAPPPEWAADISAYVIEPPDIVKIYVSGLPKKAEPIQGERLVRPDGTVALGSYGTVSVSGLTPEQARVAILEHLASHVKKKRQDKLDAVVEVKECNSKVYYVIADSENDGQQVVRIACKGNETVADAIRQVNGLAALAAKNSVWIARPAANGQTEQIWQVDWYGIVREKRLAAEYPILPGDRVFVGTAPGK